MVFMWDNDNAYHCEWHGNYLVALYLEAIHKLLILFEVGYHVDAYVEEKYLL